MKKLLLYIQLILFTQNIIAQCYFQKVFDYNKHDNIFNSVTQTSDNGFFMVGGNFNQNDQSEFYYYKADSCGNKVFDNSLLLSIQGGEFGFSTIEISSKDYLVFGTIYDSIEKASDTYLMKISANGNYEWHTIIDAGFNDRAVMMKQLKDGNLILGGYMHDTSYTTTKTATFLIKSDTFGNVIWQKDYGANAYDKMYSIDLTLDGGFILGGSAKALSDYDHFLIKTDSLGDEQWRKTYGDNYTQYLGHVISLADGGYLQAGYVDKGSNYLRALLRKTDSAGMKVWEKELGREDFSDIYSIKELPGGDIIAGGHRSIDSFPNEAPRVWILKLKENGDIIWDCTYSYYGGRSHTYAADFKLLQDSSMIFAGFSIPLGMDSTRNNGYLLRTDKMGCIIPGCDTIGTGIDTSTVVSFINNKISHFNIYPNPNNGKFEIDINIEQKGDYSIEVRNVLGQKIYHEGLRNFSGPYQKRLDLGHKAKGTYLISLKGKNGEVVKRVVIF